MADLYNVVFAVDSEPTHARFESQSNAEWFADALAFAGIDAKVVDEFADRGSDDKVVYKSEARPLPNGLYLIADTPPTAHPIAVEDGSGDRSLLREVLAEHGVDVVGDDGTERRLTTDPFVVEHAVPKEDAVTYCHVGFDTAYHPAGGIWFPSDVDPDPDMSGWVRTEDELTTGDVIQYPAEDRPPRVVGKDTLPDWVVDRVTPEQAGAEQ